MIHRLARWLYRRRLLGWLCPMLFCAWGVAPIPCAAQQNLFNVPSGHITTPDELFFQQQLNINSVLQTSITLDYGLGHGWEVGVNLFDGTIIPIPITTFNQEVVVSQDLLVNAQKSFELTDVFHMAIGGQVGRNLNDDIAKQHFVTFDWVVASLDVPELRDSKFYVGGYYGNRHYAGDPNRFGFMLGTEIPIIEEKVHFMADYISGQNTVALGVIGVVVLLPKHWSLSIGAQVPSPGSGNPYGGVLELTRVVPPKAHRQKTPIRL